MGADPDTGRIGMTLRAPANPNKKYVLFSQFQHLVPSFTYETSLTFQTYIVLEM